MEAVVSSHQDVNHIQQSLPLKCFQKDQRYLRVSFSAKILSS